MNSFPTNNYTSYDDTNHPSLPFTHRQLDSQDIQAPTFINDLSLNDLFDLGDSNVDTRVVPTPQVLPHGTLPRHVNPLFRRRLINVQRKRHIRPGSIPKGFPSQSTGFNASPQANIPRCHVRPGMLVPQAPPQLNAPPQSNTHVDLAPQLTIDSTSDPTTHPLASFPFGSSSAAFESGGQLSFSGFQNMPTPMTSGLVPSGLAAAASSSS